MPDSSNTTASVNVRLPADAEVWFDGRKMTISGVVRRFLTPPLEPGDRYSYEVIAQWEENGQTVTRTQRVTVTAGATVDVVFPAPPVAAGAK
jgi:uncharacterized protein (TIGR03000 family)